MSINPDIRDQAYQFFVEEAQELLQIIEDGLLGLREDRDTAKIHQLMRAAHSIKGGAASVELDAIKSLSHRLEDIFKALYSDNINFDAELESLLLSAFDCLKDPLLAQIELGEFDAESALNKAAPIFAQLEERLSEALKETDSYIPSATDLGVDIVASIFEVDVAEAIEKLRQVVKEPDNYDIAAEIRNQVDVFNGFAELLNLPGFAEISQTAVTALAIHPEQAWQIAQLMIADCEKARTDVLAGDRQVGGKPCAELQFLTQASSLSQSLLSENSPADLNDIFAEPWEFSSSELNPAIFADSELKLEENELEPPSLDEVFGSPPAPQPVIAPTEDISLEDVFGTEEELAEEEVTQVFSLSQELTQVEFSSSEPLLNEVFAEIPATPVADSEPVPSLDDLFGGDLALSETPNQPEEIALAQRQSWENSLENTVESIQAEFTKLPGIETKPLKLPSRQLTKKTKTSIKPNKSSAKQKNQKNSNLSVRVDMARLERMNNLISELIINRNSLALQNEQLQASVKQLREKFTRFRDITGLLRETSDKMLVNNQKTYQTNFINYNNSALRQGEFDVLEMDSYNQVDTLVQNVLEEMMQLEETADDIGLFAKQSDESIEKQRQMIGQMRDELMWARMLPLSQILQRFPRILRDLSNTYNKPVNLKMTGTGVLVDKAVLEKLYDPLLHLLRNAFDHGIENTQLRHQAGKAEQGTIEIDAYYQGNQTIIEIRDDGGGIDYQKIARKAVSKGIISENQIATLSQAKLLDLIFEPDFSTASQVSEISGRGVGLNVVRSQIQALKGNVTVKSELNQGTTFILSLPLTLTIAKLLVCSANSLPLAFPSDSIEEIVIPTSKQIKVSGKQRLLYWRNELLPIYNLGSLLSYNCAVTKNSYSKALQTVASPADWALPLLLWRQSNNLFALEVERLITEEELVIKPFGKLIAAPEYTYGCTILGDGTLIPVINAPLLLDFVQGKISPDQPEMNQDLISTQTATLALSEPENSLGTKQAIKTDTILVVDDSTALRRTLALNLEKQGYRVYQAGDGKQALEQLNNNEAIDLVICDVEMPNMNGFEFLGMRRRSPKLKAIPVAMLTSRSNEKHRNLAKQLGADAYFTKPYIEQEFLAEIKN
ncbi:MAG: hybrid sensor histidine kinase/response regulator, partial [Cyanobacteria bacterium J083]